MGYFLCKNCNPFPIVPPTKKCHPFFPINPPLKVGTLSSPPFWKFGWRLNSPRRRGRGCVHCDLPLNNSAVMVKWKCLKFLYSSKGMWSIDNQLKKLMRLKYFILETPYTFFFIFSWYFSFKLYTHLTLYHLCFQVLSTKNFPFLASPTFPILCLFLQL